MKLGDVLRKERETKGLTAEEISKRLGVPPDEYKAIKAGDSPLEKYGALARISNLIQTSRPSGGLERLYS